MTDEDVQPAPSEIVVGMHDSLQAADELKKVLLLEFRCPQDEACLLLHVWRTPQARLYYLPRYTLSRSTNESQTVDSARQKRTEDGDKKWKASGGSLDYLFAFFQHDLSDNGLPLNCRHLRRSVSCAELIAALDEARPGKPVRVRVTRH